MRESTTHLEQTIAWARNAGLSLLLLGIWHGGTAVASASDVPPITGSHSGRVVRMTSLSPVDGINLRLRLVTIEDAAYIFGLRNSTLYNLYLSKAPDGVDQQRSWINDYKEREEEGREYYYLIQRVSDDRACGVVRLYNIENDHFTWGSWILDSNKTEKAALESAVLSFSVAFERLKLDYGLVDVMRQNTRAISFYRRFNMVESHEDGVSIYFQYFRDRFEADKPRYLEILRAETDRG